MNLRPPFLAKCGGEPKAWQIRSMKDWPCQMAAAGQLDESDFGIGVDHRLLIHPVDAKDGAHIEGVLSRAVSWAFAVEFAMFFFMFARSWRCQAQRMLNGEIDWAMLAQPAWPPNLAPGRPLDCRFMDLGTNAVFQQRFVPADLHQRQPAIIRSAYAAMASVLSDPGGIEAVEAVDVDFICPASLRLLRITPWLPLVPHKTWTCHARSVANATLPALSLLGGPP